MDRGHNKYLLIFTLVISSFFLTNCGEQTATQKQDDNLPQTETFYQPAKATQMENIKPGSICTVDNGNGKFGIVKVLVINDQIAHLKIYKNEYVERPANIDIKTLSMGSINDKDGFGIGHVPLDRKGFDNWKPVILGFESVSKEDLEGYEIWRNQ